MSTSQLNIDDLLMTAVARDASDIHIKAETPPLLRIYGELIPTDLPPLSEDEAKRLSYSILTQKQRDTFEQDWELDLGYDIEGLARFRVNLFVQRGMIGSVFRIIPLHIQTIEELALPDVCRYFSERPRGLVLVTGPAGCGKSTTQAAMIDHVNKNFPVHVVTVEDPIEFIHDPKVSLINQRELGRDTRSFANALKFVLRQDPDVILVGEMRDLETVQLAIRAAETGHLVLGTLHTTDAVQTVDRAIDIFPTHQQQQIRMQLSVNLLGVVSQILVRRADGRGRVAAFETLVAISSVRNSIRERKTHQIASVIQTGTQHGMMTLDQSLAHLVRSGVITFEEGETKAKNAQEYGQLVESGETVAAKA
jgi:twitching motility protein PilT